MMQRIQKIISNAGIASRRTAEEMIKSHRVSVNGIPAVLGQSADSDKDEITIDGISIAPPDRRIYIMLNKPKGYVSTLSDEKGRKTVADLVSDIGVRLYPVGRLDMFTEGLIIMTNDGAAAHRLMHPSHNVIKVYHATVAGEDIPSSIEILRREMMIDGYKIRPAEVDLLKMNTRNNVHLAIKIKEGRNRQVRKMCAQAGLRVLNLRRVAEGALFLGDLASGKWRYLSSDEVAYLACKDDDS